MKIRSTALLLGLAVVAAGGCNAGSNDGRSNASTVAPVQTANSTAPTATSTTPTIVTPPTPTPTPPTTVTGNADVVVASLLLNQVSVCDMNTGAKKGTVPVGKAPLGVATSGNSAYVANSLGASISVVDMLTNTVSATLDPTAAGVTNFPLIGNQIDPLLKPLVRPVGVAVTPDGKKAYSANLITVASYDTATSKTLNSISGINLNLQGQSGIGAIINLILNNGVQNFLNQPLAALGQAKVACTNDKAFVTNMVTGNVTVLSVANDSVLKYTKVGAIPMGVTCAGTKVYVCCIKANEVYVLDQATGDVTNHFAAGQVPVDVCSSPKGDYVYVANLLGGDVTVIDTASDLPVDTLPCGMSIGQIFSQLGISAPSSTSGGFGGLVSGFLSGFLGGSGAGNNAGIGGLLGGSSPLSPQSLIQSLFSGFLGFAGISQSQLNSMNMPGIGVLGASISADSSRLLCANLMFGLTITEIATKTATAPQFFSGQGLGASAVSAGR